MKKISKQLVALLLAVVMVLPMGVFSANPFVTQAEAASITESTVTSKLNSISNEYKGKAFSKNKSVCSHSNEKGCNNCYLGTILDAKGISRSSYNYDGYTCWAFVSYCFTQCFGKKWISDNYTSIPFSGTRNASNVKAWLEKYASVGDILCWSGHYVVIRSISNSGIKIMDANYDGSDSKTGIVRDKVETYDYIAKHGELKLHHAVNYNTKNVYFKSLSHSDVTKTNAKITANLYGTYINKAGCYIGTSTDSMTKYTETINSWSNKVYYKMDDNVVNSTLKPNTTYYYKIFITVNGVEYCSEVKSFKTLSNTLSVYYNANGGSISSDTYYLSSGDIYKSSDNSKHCHKWTYNNPQKDGLYNATTFGIYKTGYEFVGWSTTSSGEIWFDQDDTGLLPTHIDPNIKNGDRSVTMYAVWKKASSSYTLTYNANGGSGAPSSQSGATSYTVSSTKPTRSGYTFLGWSTNSSATSAAYVGGNTISLSANTTLYAVWKKNESVSYTVTFYGNGGTNVPEAETFSAGEWITIPEDMPSFLGYTFSGWSETADFSSAVYYPGDEVSFGGNVNLFAIWREYHASEGYTGLDISYEQPYYCMKFVPEETGEYVIKTTTVEEPVDTIGYLVNGNGETIVDDDDSGEDFNFKISYTFTKGRTYYIYITTYGDNYGNVGLTVMPTAEITYDANGGYDAPDKSSHDIDYLIPDDEPYRDDYEFIGWSERSDAESASYYPGDDITVTEDLTLYAVWYSLSSEFYVYYDANGGYNAPQTQFIESNAIGYIPDEEPVRDGYIFEGWCDNANGNGSWYYPGDMIRDSVDQEDITLYAIWEEEEIDDPVDPDDPLLPGCLTIRTPSITTIKYGDTIKLHADMGNAPVAGLKVEWEFSNDNFEIVSISEDGRTCKITPSKSGQTTFTAKVKLGNRLLSSDTQIMTSKAGFFDKLIAFFREIFDLLKDYEQAINATF